MNKPENQAGSTRPAAEKARPRTRSEIVSRKRIEQVLSVADEKYAECWEILVLMKKGSRRKDVGRRIIDFQKLLVGALSDIEALYREVKREEKVLVKNKAVYKPAWFRSRMAKLAAHTKVLKDILAIGRALGDAFAWFFYERDRELIDEHLKHQRQILLPNKVGGLGERIALERMQGLAGKFLIYHGTTTFLRIGDVSLIDLNTLRVSSVGEIKTRKIDDTTYELSLSLITDDRAFLDKLKIRPNPNPATPLDPKVQGRLDRQVKTVAKTIRNAQPPANGISAGRETEFYYSELADVVRRSHTRHFEFVQTGAGMVVGALRVSKKGTLSSNFLGHSARANDLAKGSDKWALKIMQPHSKRNSLSIGTISGASDLVLRSDMLPMFWWQLPNDVSRDLIFSTVMVITLYNPMPLWTALGERGFELDWADDGKLRRAARIVDGRRTELENFDYFHRLIQHALMKEEGVLGMIDLALAAIRDKADGKSVRADLRPRIIRHASLQT